MSTPITGNLKDLIAGAVTSRTFVRITLRGTAGNQPRVNGTALIVPKGGGTDWYQDFVPDSVTGAITGSIYSTRDAAGTGNGEIEVGGSLTAVWYEAQIYHDGRSAAKISFHAKNGVSTDITSVTPLSVTPVVTAPSGDTTYLRLDGGNLPSSGTPGIVRTAPSATQTVVQPTGTSLNVNRFENIRFADQFASISAAIADLPAAGGMVFIPAGTYSDNITITKSVTLIGADKANCIINPASTASPVITIDATSVASIDGITIKNLTIPSPVGASSDAIKITGKQAANEVCDHIVLEDLMIGSLYTFNTAGTTGFTHGINISGRAIYMTINRVVCNGHKGDGLHLVDSGGIVGPVNDLKITSSQFNNSFGYGIRIDGTGSVTPHTSISLDTVETSSNAQNTALSPSAGILINGVWMVNLYNHYFEANCPSSADANAAQLRITGSQATAQQVSVYGATLVMTASAAKFGILNDATVSTGFYDSLRFIGVPATATVKVACTDSQAQVIVGVVSNGGKITSTADSFGTTHVTAPAMSLFARKIINNGQYPLSANSFDLVTSGGGNDFPSSVLGVTGGPVTINTITSGTKGQYLWLDSNSGAITLTHNSGGAGSFLMNDTTTRVLQTADAILFRHDGTNWQEVSLGTALLGKANTWLQTQAFASLTATGKVTNYNSIATVGNGVPSVVAQSDLTVQGAAIGTTTLYAVPASGAGQYRISWNAKVTTADGVSSTLGAMTITYTDPDGTVVGSAVPGAISGGAVALTATTNNVFTTLTGMPLLLNCKASTNIQFSFAYVSNTPGQMKYNLHLKLEAL